MAVPEYQMDHSMAYQMEHSMAVPEYQMDHSMAVPEYQMEHSVAVPEYQMDHSMAVPEYQMDHSMAVPEYQMEHSITQNGAQQHGGPQVPDGEAGQREPSQLDLLSVIAIGMRQLQDAQTKAFQKKTTAAVLKGPDPATSPVEVQDWLQLLQAPMSDLSDNSGDWWWPRSPTRSGPERRQWSG
eukprot:s508_g30.t1